jgi:hypothetical protein
MSFKTFDQLSAEIDAAVHLHPDGPLGKTTASGVNALLKSLAAEVTLLPQDEQSQTPYLFQVGEFSVSAGLQPETPHIAKLSVAQAKYLVENQGTSVDIFTNEANGYARTVNVSYNTFSSEFVVNSVTGAPSGVLLNAWLVGRGRPENTSALEFVFEAGFANSVTRTMGPRQAATYRSEQQQNIASVNYQLNGTAVALPLTLVAGDMLQVTLTRTDPAAGAVLALLS